MLSVNNMSKYQAFRWLWRNDPEARWYWFRCFLKGSDLRTDVTINLRDFGLTKRPYRGSYRRY